MTIQEEIEKMDAELKAHDLPFDKGIVFLREKLWAIAERHNTTGADIMALYMNWKSGKVNK